MTINPAHPRLAPVAPPYSPEVQAAFDTIMRGAPPLLLFRTLAHNPRVLMRVMAGGLLDRGSVSIRQRELVILRTTARCGAEYEWGVHVAVYAGKAGLSTDEIQRTCSGSAADWPDSADALCIALVDALHERHRIDDTLWAALRARFEDAQLVELVMLAGLYHAISFVANAFELPREVFAPAFPARA